MCMLIADISGYTGYLAAVELVHAQDILADLIGAVVSSVRPNFRLSKLEGDAAFTYMPAERIDGSMLLDTIERCYFGFRRRRRDVGQATSCECNACARIPDLDLKFVAHYGEAVIQKVAGRQELVGSDVIVVHRLLKNDVVERLGMSSYALITEQCLAASDLSADELGFVQHSEAYERIGTVSCRVLDLERRWQAEEERARVRVSEEDAVVEIVATTTASPQVAWDFLTRPGQRMSWQPWVTVVTVKAPGGRRGTGSANHCMHGKDAVIEEILDWRPYDYVTDRTVVETPAGPLRFLHTIEFEPTPSGTIVHMRYALPPARKNHALAQEVAVAYGAALQSSMPTLCSQLDAEHEARSGD